MIYEPKFGIYYDASMTRKYLTICPIKFCKCRAASRWFHDLECNYRLWIVTHIWYKSLNFETIMMSRWPERNWRILFVPLNFVNVGMPRWFYDLEFNSRLWIVTQIWYISLSFETIMIPPWPRRNWQILFVPLNFVNVGLPQWFYYL